MVEFALWLIAIAGLALGARALRRRRSAQAEPVADPASLRQTAHGPVVGFTDSRGLHAWLGIPYAAPPVGALRWRAPQPPQPWTAARVALAYGPKPMQVSGPAGGFPRATYGQPAGSEDCLYVNVWAPRAPPEAVPRAGARLPVMVWIYGGGNAGGAANVAFYDPAWLTHGHGVVAVSFNYRLGVFGWFRHPALGEEACDDEDRSGNFGTLDIVAALRWVRDNIAAFGGDAGNVTIFGESAGGINVMSLLLCPQARGLFHRAIAQSGVIAPYAVSEAENYVDDAAPGHRNSSREIVAQLLVRDGRAANRNDAKSVQASMTPAEIRGYLYGKGPEELLAVFDEVFLGMYMNPRPIADGYVLPAGSWHEAYADPSRYSRVPLLMGSNRDEYLTFMMADTVDYVDPRRGRLPRIREPERYARDGQYQSDLWRASSVDEVARRMAEVPGNAVFAYRFDWDDWPRLPGMNLRRLLGAGHGLELMFLFGTIAGRPALRYLLGGRRFARIVDLTAALTSYWVQFARTGDPGRGVDGTLPLWQRWSNAAGDVRLLVLDEPGDGGIRMTEDLITVASLQQRLVDDPSLAGKPLELQRVYARLFVYGLHGTGWDQSAIAALADLAPGGARRAGVLEQRPRILP